MTFRGFVPAALGSSISLASVLLTAQPSQAVTPCAAEGSFLSSQEVFTPGFECFIDDKLFKNFEYVSGSIVGISWNWGLVPGSSINQYTLQGTKSTGLADFKFKYQVDITEPDFFFDQYRTSATTSVIDTPSFIKSLTPFSLPLMVAAGPAVSTAAGGGTSSIGTFVPDTLTSIMYESELIATGAGAAAQNFTDTLIQRNPPPQEEVPGPLPILGAGMAFAYSRRVRGRIAKTKAV